MDISSREIALDYALRFLGVPYLWGGSDPDAGFDCSGLVSEALMAVGILRERLDAQAIYEALRDEGIATPSRGAVLFFGTSVASISHVALALSDKIMVEAAGGCHTTTDRELADKALAFVKIRPICSRKDLIAKAMPRYDN